MAALPCSFLAQAHDSKLIPGLHFQVEMAFVLCRWRHKSLWHHSLFLYACPLVTPVSWKRRTAW